MAIVALVGADGAGKTTIAHMLEASFPRPTKYLYMGANIESSNFRLPTSRLILYLKLRSYRKKARRKGITDPSYISTHHMDHRSVKYGKIGSTLRLINRLAEGWYRQFISLAFQLRGYIVVYDRDQLLDAAVRGNNQKWTERIYIWTLKHMFSRPDLLIFLDAPAEILHSRKGETTVSYLNNKRDAYLAQGEQMPNFIQVDASRPLDSVYSEVSQLILNAYRSGQPGFEVSER